MNKNNRKTEQILNSTYWVDGNGEIHSLIDLDKDHLHNILNFLYRNRNRYWLNCQKTVMIESFNDGDEFFQKVIRKSTLWNAIIDQLNVERNDFNFAWDEGSRNEII